jgi:hypothetical protein
MNKNFIRKSAMEYLNKYYGFFTPTFKYYYINFNYYNNINNNCIEEIIKNIDYFKLFEELLNIDYENKIVSFAYFSKDTIENFKSHPIYKIINNSLEYDYEIFNSSLEYEKNIYYIYNNQDYNIVYYKPDFKSLIPYKSICGAKPYRIVGGYKDYISQIYNEYEYISSMISFISVSPQKFM